MATAVDVVKYIVRICEKEKNAITNMQLQKLLYCVQQRFELMTVWKRPFSTYEGTWCTIYDKGGTVIFSGCVDSSGYNAIRKL